MTQAKRTEEDEAPLWEKENYSTATTDVIPPQEEVPIREKQHFIEMTNVKRPHQIAPVREDDHFIEFSNTRGFAAEKWKTAVEAQEITAADWARGKDVDTYVEYGNFVRQSIIDSKTAQQKSALQSLLTVARPVMGFIDAFEKRVAPEDVNMSIIWSLMYLNISHALPQAEKLKRITTWFASLKRLCENLNQCIENCSDENSARTQATDVFDPMLSLLTGILRFQRTYVSEAVFASHFPTMKEFVNQTVEEIDLVVYHFRQIAQHTREQQDLNARRAFFKGMPFRAPQDNPYDRAGFPLNNLPAIRRENFFGREGTIERIDNKIGNQKDERLRTYLIYGLRGVGKTQIALEYARRYLQQEKYDAVFWIRCETSATLRQSFSDIAIALELSSPDQGTRFEENQIKVLEWLKKTSKTWLLIYDNAERDQTLNAYWPREATGSILLTSRSYYNFEHSERREGETIDVFSEEERWDLLMELLGADWQRHHLGGQNGVQERGAARKLLNSLGGLALAIAQAATLILERRITKDQSIVTLLEVFERTSRNLPPRLSGHRNEKIHALDTIMAIALNHVSRSARSLLGTFSLLAPDSIPIDLFLPADQSRLNGRLEFCKQKDPGAAVEMSPRMRDAIIELKEANLIQQDGRTFVIHRVIQEAMNFTDMDDLQSSFSATVELLHEAFPVQLLGRPLVNKWPICQLFVSHVVHLTKAFATYQRSKHEYLASTFNFIQLLSNCGWYLYEVADYVECLDMMSVACANYDDKRSLLYSHLVNIQGGAYYEKNQLKKARAAFVIARELREFHLPSDHPQLATSLSNLGNVETADNNLDDAQMLFEHAARIKEGHGEEEIISLGMSFLQLGRVAALRDETLPAVRRYDKAEACFLRQPGQSQQFMAFLHYARGNLELGRRDIAQATAQYDRCREACHMHFPVHPLAAAVYYKLALCDIARGRKNMDKALVNLEKAYNIATIRSYGEIDGTVARIQWKRAELMIDDPIQREDGIKMRAGLKLELQEIAMESQLQLAPDWTDDESFDMLVPGYFR